MTQNLTNVYAYLRKTYPDVDMLFAKPVSYIKSLVEDDTKVVFVYKEDHSRMKSPRVCDDSIGIENYKDSSLNLTGSPLEDDLSIVDLLSHSIATKKLFVSKPWHENEESFMPIDINLAREIIINVSNQTFPKDSHGWIFILCADSFDEINNATFLLSSYISPQQNAHGVGKYYGMVHHEDKSMENLLKRHFSLISSKTKLNTRLESVFEIKPEMSLKFINNTSAANPSMSHVNNTSEAILYQKIAIGRNHVLCDQFWSQIQHLNMIKTDIVNFKNSSMDGTFVEPPYNYGLADANFENLQSKITQILNDVNSIGDQENEVVDNSLEGVLKRARIRPLMEITDQLWDQLKHTSSYGDLKKIITYIFQVSSRSNIVNIPTNNNRLGELIRELCLQRLAIPHLVGTEPVELLLEVGIEKLMKDYEFILSESKICKLSEMTIGGKAPSKVDNRLSIRKSLAASVDLNQSDKMRKTLLKTNGCLDDNEDEEVGIRNSRFVEREVEANISKLAQIHLVIEHLLLIQNNINMENDYSAIAKKLLEKPLLPFEDLQSRKYDKFEFPISDRKVCHLVDNLIPNAQTVTMESSNKFKLVKNVFHFNIEQIVPHLLQKEKDREMAIDKSGNSFHFLNYTTISGKY